MLLTSCLNMMCNAVVSDSELIDTLGGPSAVAALLGYPKWGTQRVSNWKTRGIPARVKVQRPDLFMSAAAPLVPAVPVAAGRPDSPESNAWPLQAEQEARDAA